MFCVNYPCHIELFRVISVNISRMRRPRIGAAEPPQQTQNAVTLVGVHKRLRLLRAPSGADGGQPPLFRRRNPFLGFVQYGVIKVEIAVGGDGTPLSEPASATC